MRKQKPTQPMISEANEAGAANEPSRDDVREAARVLKTKGSKKRERRRAAGVMSVVGSSKGGHNRARNLTEEQRREIARLGGLARQALAREQREQNAASRPLPKRGRSLTDTPL